MDAATRPARLEYAVVKRPVPRIRTRLRGASQDDAEPALGAAMRNAAEEVVATRAEAVATRAEIVALRTEFREEAALLRSELQRAIDAIQIVYDEEPANRRRLHALRESTDYKRAFTDAEPLISVVVPTYTSYETLRDRAIPSVLAQTYQAWELVVVGDSAPPETARVIAEIDDSRIRFSNSSMRGPYPEDEYAAWLVTGVPPFNAARRLARGQWVVPFADDDALRPDALERMLAHVQRHGYEFCYGKLLLHARDGTTEEIGKFPPPLAKHGIEVGMQGAFLHGGLGFIEQELADAIFRTPNDWSMVRRMLRVGVRFGFVDEIVCDYFPSYRGEDAPNGQRFR
jgi:hypothetical protein